MTIGSAQNTRRLIFHSQLRLISHCERRKRTALNIEISNSSSSVKANLVESAGTSKNRNKGKDKHVKITKKNFTPRQNDHKILNRRSCYGASRLVLQQQRIPFPSVEEVADGEQVYMGNDGTARVIGKGKVFLKFTSGKTLALNNVLYVPSLRRNMVSGSLLVRAGLKVTLEGDKVIITRNNDFVGKGYVTGGLFVLNTESSTNESSASAYIVESANMWHGRLGHLNIASIKKLKTMNLINVVDAKEFSKCPICVEAKHAKKSFKNVAYKSTQFCIIHSDLADFKNTMSKGGKKYYITFMDDYSRYTKVYLFRSKDEAEEMFLKFKSKAENQLDKRIKRLRSDRGGEYSTNFLKDFCEKCAAYRFMCLDDNSICESRDAEFFESNFPLKKNDNSAISSLSNSTASTTSSSVHACSTSLNNQENELRRSKRKRVDSSFGPDFITAFLVENDNLDKVNDNIVSVFLLEEDPKTYKEALTSIDASFWKEAIKSELDSIMVNNTWDVVDLPKGCKPIKCKWIFKRKMRPDNTIEKFKARSLIALASIYELVIHQMDVKTAFLNGDLEEEIYMEQPEGLMEPNKNKVCKLKKSLYGLKQAPKQWYMKFDHSLISNGFVVNASDTCVYSKVIASNCVIICLYVDDMLIFGTNINVVNETKTFLSSQFDMKDLGEVDVILGIKVRKTENGYSLCQSHYIEKVLKRFDYFDVDPVKTPYDSSKCLKKNKGTGVSQPEYAKIIGSVMFLMNYTRPDIAYAVSRLSRYTHNPSNEHWDALYRLLQYLKVFKCVCTLINFPAVLEDIVCNWVSDNDEVSSTSGYVFTLGGCAISWKSSKQTCIARSTMEAEFIALELAGQEAEWLRNLLADIPLWKKQSVPVSIHCDSQAAIGIAKNSVYNGKKRHIRIRHGIVKQLLKNGVICLDYVRSENNLADPFTKGLPRKVVLESSRGMGLKPMN
ncbi:retrovirus-related pol polyprotein from transposon TNT 1-94 [Tanacetum coccineum]